VDRERLAAQRRDDEVRHDAAVRRLHARPVRVEDSGNARVDPVLAPVVREHRLGAALPFVVARARPDRIDVSPVVFGLRMLTGSPQTSLVEACRIGARSRFASPSKLIAPCTLVFVLCTGSRW
jgi:hypothetical protein